MAKKADEMLKSRRDFIKQSVGAVSVSLVMPHFWVGTANAQAARDPNRRVLVVIQMLGGNDGLNTVIPYADAAYHALRPTLSFKEAELKDAQGRSTIISDRFGFNPAMGSLKELYDAGKVAVVQGVGYPQPNQSHFLSEDFWHTANIVDGRGNGWLGKYADEALAGHNGFHAAAIGGQLPRSLFSDRVVVPNIADFEGYNFQTDPRYPASRSRKLDLFNLIHSRRFPEGSIEAAATGIGADAVAGVARVASASSAYSSTIIYPAGNRLADALRMLAQIITSVPEANLLYVQMGFFDHHADQIGESGDKLAGLHTPLLGQFSDAVKAFYDDLAEHHLAENVLILQWSEFGRRAEENNSRGTDHGSSSSLFLVGDKVKGGLHGEQPSLTDLDEAGNLKFEVDFRSVYAEVLEQWLSADSRSILGGQFEQVGFLA